MKVTLTTIAVIIMIMICGILGLVALDQEAQYNEAKVKSFQQGTIFEQRP